MCSRRTKQIAQQLHWWAVQDWTTPSSNSFRTIKQIQNALMKSTRIAQWKLTFTLLEVNDIDLNFITKYPWYFYSVNTWNSLKFDLSYGPWNSVLKSLLTGLWPFFFNVDEKRFDRDCLWPQCRHLIKLEWVYITSWGLFIQPIMLDLERGIDPTPSSPSFWLSLTPLVQISSSFYSSPSIKITDGSYNFHQENTQWLLANQQSDLGSYRVKTAFGFTLVLKLSYLWKRNGLKTV